MGDRTPGRVELSGKKRRQIRLEWTGESNCAPDVEPDPMRRLIPILNRKYRGREKLNNAPFEPRLAARGSDQQIPYDLPILAIRTTDKDSVPLPQRESIPV